MSRTKRRFHYKPAAGKVARDGAIQRHSTSCMNGGSCGYCLSNRTIREQREKERAEVKE